MIILYLVASTICYLAYIIRIELFSILNSIVFCVLELYAIIEFIRFGYYQVMLIQYTHLHIPLNKDMRSFQFKINENSFSYQC